MKGRVILKLPLGRAKKVGAGLMAVLKVVTEDITFYAVDGISVDFHVATGTVTGTTTGMDIWGSEITFATNKLKYSVPWCALIVMNKGVKEIYTFKPVNTTIPGEGIKPLPPEIKFSKKGTMDNVEKYENLFSF